MSFAGLRRNFHPLRGVQQRIADSAGKADDMTIEHLPHSADSPPNTAFVYPEQRTIGSYERELTKYRHTEIWLRETLARDKALLRQKDTLIQQQAVLSQESDHRLLNGLQMIAGLLSLQSRTSANAETASQLAVAANRISTIGRIHRRLHSFDGVETVAFKPYLEDLCREFSTILSSQHCQREAIAVEGIELNLPTVTGIPLGFIVNELITNAVKYGKGGITVRLEANPGKRYALSVSNDGRVLPEGFDPAVGKGLGLKIIRSLVERIGGELRISRGGKNEGTRFTVLFS
jgi:two-component system, sensor histidine kinase PdtaS